jgi:hypothetical protein
MNVGSQSIAKAENPFAGAFKIIAAVFILLAVALLHVLGVPLTALALVAATAALLWLAFRYPSAGLGAVLGFMPIYPMAFLLAKFFGPSYMGSLENCDRVVMLVLVLILWSRNGIKLAAPDWFLLACFGFGVARLAFGGSVINLLADFSFMIAYGVGRAASLTADRQKLWAERAVWIIAVLSVLGMIEVFVLGPTPRGLLYWSVAPGFTPDRTLDGRFFADSFLRESASMVSPHFFALLCMAAWVIGWGYCRNPLPAALISAGLICAVTRHAWISTALTIPLLALRMEQKKRLILYASLALALFIASIPVLGLRDFLASTKTGEEVSVLGHWETLVIGADYVTSRPFGAGPGNYDRPAGSKRTISSTSDAPWIESSYLMLAAEYGLLDGLCFAAFVLCALRAIWPQRTPLGYAAFGILVGFAGSMMFAPMHADFALACWIWFPVGLAVRSSTFSQDLNDGSEGNHMSGLKELRESRQEDQRL